MTERRMVVAVLAVTQQRDREAEPFPRPVLLEWFHGAERAREFLADAHDDG